MKTHTLHYTFLKILTENQPQALAKIAGNDHYPQLNGTVRLYAVPGRGLLIEAEIFGLPEGTDGNENSFFGFHIHDAGDCSDEFQNTGGHYNPSGALHPFHAGDLPPLMSNDGYAWTAFFDNRVTVFDVLDRSVIIHRMPDDFTSQPAGSAGDKIACGIIRPTGL